MGEQSWQQNNEKIREKLRLFYPNKAAQDAAETALRNEAEKPDIDKTEEEQDKETEKKKAIFFDSEFGLPADVWANQLLSAAHSSYSMFVGSATQSSKRELQKHHLLLHESLENVVSLLQNMPDDLSRLLPVQADLEEMVVKIKEFDAMVKSIEPNLADLVRVKVEHKSVQRAAAVDMAIRVMHIFHEHGGKVTNRADSAGKYISDLVRVLHILGEAVGLFYVELTWKSIVQDALEKAPYLKK